jgi:hypothetical protein
MGDCPIGAILFWRADFGRYSLMSLLKNWVALTQGLAARRLANNCPPMAIEPQIRSIVWPLELSLFGITSDRCKGFFCLGKAQAWEKRRGVICEAVVPITWRCRCPRTICQKCRQGCLDMVGLIVSWDIDSPGRDRGFGWALCLIADRDQTDLTGRQGDNEILPGHLALGAFSRAGEGTAKGGRLVGNLSEIL